VRESLTWYGPANAKTITDTLVTGMAQGHSPRKMIREIQRGINGPYSKARLEALVRTEMMRGFRAGLDEQYATMSHLIAGYRWCAALSSRTCLACLGMHGKVRKEPWDRFHVSCRCLSTPVVKGVTIPFPSSEDWMRRQSPATQRRMMPSEAAYDAWLAGVVQLSDFVGVHRDRTWGPAVFQRSGRDVLERAA
jgi:SPP1 gp7 family putative phage head morphogenesis protein